MAIIGGGSNNLGGRGAKRTKGNNYATRMTAEPLLPGGGTPFSGSVGGGTARGSQQSGRGRKETPQDKTAFKGKGGTGRARQALAGQSKAVNKYLDLALGKGKEGELDQSGNKGLRAAATRKIAAAAGRGLNVARQNQMNRTPTVEKLSAQGKMRTINGQKVMVLRGGSSKQLAGAPRAVRAPLIDALKNSTGADSVIVWAKNADGRNEAFRLNGDGSSSATGNFS